MFDVLSFVVMAASIVSTVFNNYAKDWVFIVWSATNAYWCCLDFYYGLYSQSILFAVYFVIAVHGIYVRYYLKRRKHAK